MTVKLQAAKDIRSAIKIIAKKGPELDNLVHDTVIQCMAHAKEHGDVTLLGELVGGCTIKEGKVTQDFGAGALGTTGYGVGDLKSWIMGHTPIRFNNSTRAIGLPKGWQAEEKWNLDAAQANPFHTHPDYSRRQVARAPFSMDTLETLVQGMLKRIDNALEAGRLEGDPDAMREYVKALTEVKTPEQDPKRMVHPKAANAEAEDTASVEKPTEQEPSKRQAA